MSFVQIIELTTADVAALQAANDDWERSTEGKRTAQRLLLARDRNEPDHYLAIVFFDSYESAMENSNLPETQAVAERFRALATTVTYRDLDIIESRL